MTFTISDFSIIILGTIFITYIITKEVYKYKIQELQNKHTQILKNIFKNYNTEKQYCEPTVFNFKKMSEYDEKNGN
jgi:CRISPR/Cas system CMR-associated protein Cmr1 (group 7 of RAMP superfamily)